MNLFVKSRKINSIYTMKKYYIKSALALLSLSFYSCNEVMPPSPVYPLPTKAQVEWQKMETYAFVHFGLNTFNDREWGYGDSDPATFNPARLDCEQWVKTFVDAGMKGVILTAKHHDGFCLWPTKLTEYCIRNTPYKDGKGDLVRELSEVCKKYGIKFGIYLSPWDRNHADYGTEKYIEYYNKQLEELLTSYGDLFEVWFDGANGGDGWYGGAKETRRIDKRNYYDFPNLFAKVNKLQPDAIIFSDGGIGCRWLGNEKGIAGETNWSFLRSADVYPGYPKHWELNSGHADGDQWSAGECDVSIRPGWFYHPEEDDKVKTVDDLTELYYCSVGRNATLLLNFPVDRNGLVHPTDPANAVDFHKNIKKQLSANILADASVLASDSRGGDYEPENVCDGDFETYWATNDTITSSSIELSLPKPKKINSLLLQEYIPLGQRVRSFKIEYYDSGKWNSVTTKEKTTTVGYKRIVRFEEITTDKLRVMFEDARGCLCISSVEAYLI